RLFGGAGVSAVELSSNLYLMIIGIFVLSVTNVIFPKLSKLSASNAQEVFGDTVKATLHAALYVVMPMTAGLMILSRPVVSLIYGGGEFDWDSVSVTARALMCFALGMPGYTVQTILSRVYFAEQNGKVPLIAGVASIAVNIALCIALIAPLDVAGLAIASSAAMTVNAVILALPLRKHGANAFDRELISNSLKAAAAAIIMAIFTNVSYSWTINLLGASGKLGTLIAIGVSVIISVIVYYAASLILRCSEARLISDTVGRLLHKKG
ncbi:MAG: polysaccharide biosynthesis C-terminal domain-containing protein, partial [Oscillospiraceae bacterium]|nr:polysaccharide biosynthesis C-terminal domain-containing protein [Oscillospiraceae bacterium]